MDWGGENSDLVERGMGERACRGREIADLAGGSEGREIADLVKGNEER